MESEGTLKTNTKVPNKQTEIFRIPGLCCAIWSNSCFLNSLNTWRLSSGHCDRFYCANNSCLSFCHRTHFIISAITMIIKYIYFLLLISVHGLTVLQNFTTLFIKFRVFLMSFFLNISYIMCQPIAFLCLFKYFLSLYKSIFLYWTNMLYYCFFSFAPSSLDLIYINIDLIYV